MERQIVKRWAEIQPDGSIALLIRFSEQIPIIGGATATACEGIIPPRPKVMGVIADGLNATAVQVQ